MDNIIFDLQTPLKVQANVDGKNIFNDLDKIYLKAPTYKDKDKTLVLKKKFIEAIFAMTATIQKQDAQEQIGDGKLDSKAIKAILFASKDFDIVAYFKHFESLLINVAFKDEDTKQPLILSEIQKINESDFEELLAKYIEVFFIVSWMKTLN
jgi:predicted thioredoxin/glutaredoxin